MSELRPDHGDVTAEYRAARSGSGYATGTRALIWVEGADAVPYLDGQLSQDLVAMEGGTVARALLLEPRGKLVAPGWVLRGAEAVGFVVDAPAVDAALERLTTFMFRVEAKIRRDERPIHEVWGSGAVETAGAAGLHPGDGWRHVGDHTVARLEGKATVRVVVAGDVRPLDEVGAIPIGSVAWSTVRIEAGEPVMGIDVDERTIPQESGLVPESVSFTKGCYVGQELVARIDSRGRVNQRLVGLVIGTNVVPPTGASVVQDGEDRGTISSVGESLVLRAPVAMGMVRREVETGSEVDVVWEGGSAPARVEALPLDDFSAGLHTPHTFGDEDGSSNPGA